MAEALVKLEKVEQAKILQIFAHFSYIHSDTGTQKSWVLGFNFIKNFFMNLEIPEVLAKKKSRMADQGTFAGSQSSLKKYSLLLVQNPSAI